MLTREKHWRARSLCLVCLTNISETSHRPPCSCRLLTWTWRENISVRANVRVFTCDNSPWSGSSRAGRVCRTCSNTSHSPGEEEDNILLHTEGECNSLHGKGGEGEGGLPQHSSQGGGSPQDSRNNLPCSLPSPLCRPLDHDDTF